MAAEFCGWLKFLYIDFISCASAGLDFIYHETVQYPIALFFLSNCGTHWMLERQLLLVICKFLLYFCQLIVSLCHRFLLILSYLSALLCDLQFQYCFCTS